MLGYFGAFSHVCQGRSTPYCWGFGNPEIMGIFSPYGIGLMSLSLISNGSNGSLDHSTAQHVYNFWSDFSPLFLPQFVGLTFQGPPTATPQLSKKVESLTWKRRNQKRKLRHKNGETPKKNRAAQLTCKSGS